LTIAPGKRFAEARDRAPKRPLKSSRTPNRDQMPVKSPAKSPAKLRFRAQRTEMTVRAGLRGGAGRTRTSNHAVMSDRPSSEKATDHYELGEADDGLRIRKSELPVRTRPLGGGIAETSNSNPVRQAT